ncbi:hypothetical protein JXI42_13155 [bacterium]|nr:hypothetical protein [bacterium]
MKSKISLLALIFLLCLSFNILYGYTFLDKSFFGDRIHTIDVRSLGMGTTGFASGKGTFCVSKNPALLSELPLLDIAFAGQALVYQEAHSFPAHGFEMEFVADNIYSENMTYYDDYALGLTVNPKYEYAPAIAMAYIPLYDFRYQFEEEVRGVESPYQDELIGWNNVNCSGNIMGFTVGMSKDFLNIINLGLAYQYLLGDRTTQVDVIYLVSEIDKLNETRLTNLYGNRLKLGLLAKPHDRFSVGLVYNTATKANAKLEHNFTGNYNFFPEFENKLSTDVELKYPASFGVGIEYRPQTNLFSRLNVDCEYTFWENAKVQKDDGEDLLELEFENTFELAGGVEHILYNDIPLRFGFHIVPEYTDNDIMTTYFDLGTAFKFSYFQLGISLEYGSKEYAEMDFFPDGDLYGGYGGTNRESKDKIKIRELRILFNLNAVKK